MPIESTGTEPAREPMGRPPINETPMTPAERQRRRRARLRAEPWNDPRTLAWSLVTALRGLERDGTNVLNGAQKAALIDLALAEMDVGDSGRAAARAAIERFLDPDTPLPVRGHRNRRGGRGHRFGERHRARRAKRREGED